MSSCCCCYREFSSSQPSQPLKRRPRPRACCNWICGVAWYGSCRQFHGILITDSSEYVNVYIYIIIYKSMNQYVSWTIQCSSLLKNWWPAPNMGNLSIICFLENWFLAHGLKNLPCLWIHHDSSIHSLWKSNMACWKSTILSILFFPSLPCLIFHRRVRGGWAWSQFQKRILLRCFLMLLTGQPWFCLNLPCGWNLLQSLPVTHQFPRWELPRICRQHGAVFWGRPFWLLSDSSWWKCHPL